LHLGIGGFVVVGVNGGAQREQQRESERSEHRFAHGRDSA
jgi:hypothetical protein